MKTSQGGIFALGTVSHAYLEFDVLDGQKGQSLVAAISSLREPRTTMGGVNLVSGFRPELWSKTAPEDAPAGVRGFNEDVVGIDGFVMPATQHDAVLWLSGSSYDVIFDVAHQAISDLKALACVAEETSSWPYRHDRETGETDSAQILPTIAVLPLEDLSEDLQDYFSEGITEEILTQLARLHPRLGVIARTSVMKYKGTRKSMRQIGRELGVTYALEGSVRRHAGRVRVSVQLIEAHNQTHLWAQSYEYLLDDVLELQDLLAREIAGQIGFQLKAEAPALAPSAVRIGKEAYEAYLKGRYFWNKRTEPAVLQSFDCFQEAIRLEPSFAAAYAGLADAHIFYGLHGFCLPAETYPKAEEAARKALKLDSSTADVHVSLAVIQALYYWNWPAAKPLFLRAIELNPSHSAARFFYAGVLSEIGHFDEAIRQIEIARALDPLSVITQAFLAYICYRNRDYRRAADEIHRSLELDPHFAVSYWYLGLIRQAQRDLEGAIDALKQGVVLSFERPLYLAALGNACGRADRKDEALNVLEKLTKLSSVRYISPFDVALVHMGLGNKDLAFEWLEKAYSQRVTRMRTLREALFDVLRSDPRFVDLMRRVGLAMEA